MEKASKIAISLPRELLTVVEKERGETGESRSQYLRRAIEALLREKQERALSQQYIRAYKKMPEDKTEVTAARRAATAILAEEPWDAKG